MSLRKNLEFRANVIARVRQHLKNLGAIEVETQTLLDQTIAHPTTRLFKVHPTAPDAASTLYLQPSPELAMRALVARGAGQIFQICRAYRDEPADATHSSEFTMLEWYCPGTSYRELEQATCGLVADIVRMPRRSFTCAGLFTEAYGTALHAMTERELGRLHTRLFGEEASGSPGKWFDALLGNALRPHTAGALVTVLDYPMHDPCFGRLGDEGRVERFELFLDGVEIANGYQEIEGASDFHARFAHENAQRIVVGEEVLPDVDAISIPRCSGVALGLDRLVSIAARGNSGLGLP